MIRKAVAIDGQPHIWPGEVGNRDKAPFFVADVVVLLSRWDAGTLELFYLVVDGRGRKYTTSRETWMKK
ncbi:MAG: hypothetical protein HPY71_15535 [Firmicutes bacterium]|nr:hypothetical protein [Bacillota bacterium]